MRKFKLDDWPDTEQAQFDHDHDQLITSQEDDRANAAISPVHLNLRRFRQTKKLKKQEMAELMGISSRTYYIYENGQRPIPSDALVRLAAATGADLHLILMGDVATNDAQVVRKALADFRIVLERLNSTHPNMDGSTRSKVANCVITNDWGDWPRTHPDVIDAAIFRITGYKYFPEDLPPPPFYEDYDGDIECYEKDVIAWQALMD